MPCLKVSTLYQELKTIGTRKDENSDIQKISSLENGQKSLSDKISVSKNETRELFTILSDKFLNQSQETSNKITGIQKKIEFQIQQIQRKSSNLSQEISDIRVESGKLEESLKLEIKNQRDKFLNSSRKYEETFESSRNYWTSENRIFQDTLSGNLTVIRKNFDNRINETDQEVDLLKSSIQGLKDLIDEDITSKISTLEEKLLLLEVTINNTLVESLENLTGSLQENYQKSLKKIANIESEISKIFKEEKQEIVGKLQGFEEKLTLLEAQQRQRIQEVHQNISQQISDGKKNNEIFFEEISSKFSNVTEKLEESIKSSDENFQEFVAKLSDFESSKNATLLIWKRIEELENRLKVHQENSTGIQEKLVSTPGQEEFQKLEIEIENLSRKHLETSIILYSILIVAFLSAIPIIYNAIYKRSKQAKADNNSQVVMSVLNRKVY
jgi:chromosome segregation ATPase